jgi:hypothetical protein
MNFSRTHPSPRYLELQQLYRAMHQHGERFLGIPPEQTFPGKSLLFQASRIKGLIERTKALTILDYGSGKGRQYDPAPFRDGAGTQWPGIIDYWGVDEVACYDPCYEPFAALPEGTFDGVISTDVLEHCPTEDIPWIVEEMFAFGTRFFFANVACFPARKRLPNGENAHCTIQPVAWWNRLFSAAAQPRRDMLWEVWLQYMGGDGEVHERKIGNT